jgi:hypothetical protein
MDTDVFPVYTEPFFELQLVFAQKIADLSQQPFHEVLLYFTAFYRIFGLDWSLNPDNLVWQAYVQGLQKANDQATYTYEFYLQRYPAIPKFTDDEHWGCFTFEYKPELKVIKLHFSNEDKSIYSPLSHQRVTMRKTELSTMFQQIQQRYPDAAQVQGGSWLYNWEAYKRLFPPVFGQSAQQQKKPGLAGRAIWSQFLRRGWSIHEETVSLFLQRVSQLERVEDYPQCFPYPVLLTNAPITIFYEFYATV